MEYKFISKNSSSEFNSEVTMYVTQGYRFVDGIRVQGDGYSRTYYVTLVKEDQTPVDDGEVYDKIQECVEYHNKHYYTHYGNPALISGDVAAIVDILTGKGEEFFQTIKNLK